MGDDVLKTKKTELFPCIIIITAFLFLLSQTWLKWGDLIIDTGSQLWLPNELLKGKILYKDIVSLYGFLPAYLIAAFYKVFGANINTLVCTGIAVTLIVSFTIYRIARLFLNQLLSTVLVINFLFVFAFGHYDSVGIFNFILPYTAAATFFMMFTALSLYFFLKFIFTENEKNLPAWALLLTAAFLCRPESALAVWPAFILGGFVLAAKQRKANRLKITAYTISPLLLAILCYGLFFSATHTFYNFKETVLGGIRLISATPLSKRWSGLDNIPLSLLKISASFLFNIIIFFGLALACRIANQFSNNKNNPAPAIIPFLTAFVFFIVSKQSSVYRIQYYCLTLIPLCGTIAYSLCAFNHTASKRSMGLLVLSAASSLIMLRIFLAASPYLLGFSLLTLPLVCYYIFFGDLLKTALENHFKIDYRTLPFAIAVFLVLMIIPFWERSSNNYKHQNKLITTSKGSLYCYNTAQTDIFWKSVDYLKQYTPKNSTVVVFPEGSGINFFAERDSPLKYPNFVPVLIELFGEEKILSNIKSTNIDYILIISRSTGEMGLASFGVDYAKKIQKWINDNYVPVKQFGAKPYASDTFGILILKRK